MGHATKKPAWAPKTRKPGVQELERAAKKFSGIRLFTVSKSRGATGLFEVQYLYLHYFLNSVKGITVCDCFSGPDCISSAIEHIHRLRAEAEATNEHTSNE